MEIDIVKVTSRGQIVIPKNIRDGLGIKKGSRLLAYSKNDEIILKLLSGTESDLEKIPKSGSPEKSRPRKKFLKKYKEVDDVEAKVKKLMEIRRR